MEENQNHIRRDKKNNNTLASMQKMFNALLPLAGILVAILNLWILSKLSPIVQDIRLNSQAIAANDRSVSEIKDSLVRIEEKINGIVVLVYENCPQDR